MSIRTAIESIPDTQGTEYLREYFVSPQFTGAHFNSLAVDAKSPDTFTAGDLYAVSTLSVTVPVQVGIALLENQPSEFDELLQQIPQEKLQSLSPDEFKKHLGAESPAQQLWDLLRRNAAGDKRWGIGPTTASKMLARKRPHLIPIEDSVVDRAIERGRRSSWELWWEALREDDYLENRAESLREQIDRPELSTLRILDVLLWMSARWT